MNVYEDIMHVQVEKKKEGMSINSNGRQAPGLQVSRLHGLPDTVTSER